MLKNNHFHTAKEKPNSSAKNPFKNEEVLQAWLENDGDYIKAREKARKTLQLTNNNKFMSFQESYLKLVHLVTKNAIVASLLMLLSLGAVSASALQAFAPEEYKPTTIISKAFNPKDFEVNKVEEKNPFTPLNYDANNNVAFIDYCDIATKFPSKYSDGEEVDLYRNYNTLSDDNTSQSVYLTSRDLNKSNLYAGPTISCFKNKPNGLEADTKYENEPNLRSVYGKELGGNGVDFIKQNLGWFITQSDLNNLRIYQDPINNENYTIYFVHNSLHYLISYQTTDYTFNKLKTSRKIQVIPGQQIQVQFISLVNSSANKQVLDQSGTPIDSSVIAYTTKAIVASPKNSNLEKVVNDIPYSTDGYHQDSVCGVFGVVTYKVNNDQTKGFMTITSSKLNLSEAQKKSYDRFSDVLNGKSPFSPDFANRVLYDEQFLSNCTGSADFKPFIDAPQISYPGTDKVKVIYALGSQNEVKGPVVLIFASKGDNQILLESILMEDRYKITPIAEACGLRTDGTPDSFDVNCYENKLKADTALKAKLDQIATELVKTYEL